MTKPTRTSGRWSRCEPWMETLMPQLKI